MEHSDTKKCDGYDFRKLLNISSETYGHGRNPQNPHRSNLRIIDRSQIPITTELVWMQVPHARLETAKEDDVKVIRTLPNHGVPKRIADRSKEVYLKFEVNKDFHLVSREYPSGVQLMRKSIGIADADGGDINLWLDNSCPGNAHSFVRYGDCNQSSQP